MAKLPKKKTMVDTIYRVRKYNQTLNLAGKLSSKEYLEIANALKKLIRAVDK